MAANSSFVVELPSSESVRALQVLRDHSSELTMDLDSTGYAKIEFVAAEGEKDDLLLRLQLACPSAHVATKLDGRLSDTAVVPEGTWVGELIKCPNKNCITAQPKEPTKPRFRIVSWKPATLQCFYCGRYIGQDALAPQLS